MDLKKKETKEWHANHGGKYTNFEEKYMQKGGPRKAIWMAKKKKLVVLKIQFLRLPKLTMLIHKNVITCRLSKALGKDKERKRNTGHKILQLLRKFFKKHKRYNFVISSDLMSRRNKGSENI